MMSAMYDDELSKRFDEHVKPILAVNDKLRKLVELEADINTSTIVAVGDQSHGKSSVIEALSGVLLPRGQGMKTKLPLNLHLRDSTEEKAVLRFPGRPDKTISLPEVASAIDDLTAEVVGEDVVDIKDEEIELTVYRVGQIDLDLIDLPGMTRATGERGSDNIEERIKTMYKKYMKPPEAVLLNVVAAQTDTGNSTGFKMSIDFDADRNRTLLCYTKMDSYTESATYFVSRVKRDLEAFSLDSRDVFCVRNRSQAESDNRMSLKEAAVEETKFFADPESVALAANRQLNVGLGRAELAQRLAHIQRKRITDSLPKVLSKVSARLSTLEHDLQELPVIHGTESDCIVELQQRLSNISLALTNSRQGRSTSQSREHLVVIGLHLEPESDVVTKTKDRWEVTARWTTSDESNEESGNEVPSQLRLSVREKNGGTNFTYSVQVQPSIGSRTMSLGTHKPGKDIQTQMKPKAVEVQIVIRGGQQTEELMSCSLFARCKDKFVEAVRTCKPLTFFFSETFCEMITDRHEQYRGHEGLPGTLPSHVAVDVARELQQDIYPLANDFTDDAVRDAEIWMEREVSLHLKAFPSLHEKAVTALRQVIESARSQLQEDLKLTQQCFDQVMLEDHYYSFVLKDIRAKVDAVRGSKFNTLGFLTDDILRSMGNHENGILDEITQLAAYWKAMCKEFSGHVSKLVKLRLLSETIEKKLVAEIMKSCVGSLLQLMAPSKSQQERRMELEIRIKKLRTAKRECEDAVAKLLTSN